MNITKPTLLLNEQKCRLNIEKMIARSKHLNSSLRPHFKTHQSKKVGEWFKEYGIDKCAVSSLEMAKYFYNAGWVDVTVAFPLNVLEYTTVNDLAGKIKLSLCIESLETVQLLNDFLEHPIGVFLKIDAGYHRTGLDAENFEKIEPILQALKSNPLITIKGFLQHAGHTYRAKGKKEINKIHAHTSEKMIRLKNHFQNQYPDLIISNGDTPTCSVSENFEHIDEMRPGNFVFYDVMQAEIGSCGYEDIAVAMACPVVAKHPDRNEVIIYGGAIHFSKDQIQKDGQTIYGLIAEPERKGWGQPKEGWFVKKLSQEHGTLHVPDQDFDSIKIGDLLYILPIHSCLTANLMSKYYTLDGEGIEMFRYQS
ncbi:D-serine deaminase, pyridoxal phosphate-dependent [Marivirga sericea]|uniref:D-serine deaminase, pyridoxal phosphate-dependent n=1 Tax=Marivirga sericea TaxID=1028 RepID=A0A1X7IPE3_9BACT|nr:alanine racemase [Marivirga sericea]SMG16901.1 D-serine deaminase, pyridoxal phosphate-dependent [Marivirga sericea]